MNNPINDFFPLGLASGSNFCNRTEERKRLIANIEAIKPTLVMSTRRYGKTSLVLFILNKLKIPFAQVDLFSEIDEDGVQNTILGAIGDILYSIESAPKKALNFVTEFFSGLNISFTLENARIRARFLKSKETPAKNILASLKKLDEVLQTNNKVAVLFMDEFQRLAQISESATIEGSLRHIAQSSKNIMFIFSGSNRNILSSMFYDKNKPLYKLCDRIALDRISQKDYIPFIQEKAQKKWGKPIPKEIVELILNTTESHPYYVNALCYKLWLQSNIPDSSQVTRIWHQYAMEEKPIILNEMDLLSPNQAKMLVATAKYGDEHSPMSKDFLSLTKFSLSSASQAIITLEKKDYIYINQEKKYRIVDPLIKYIFLMK